MFLLKIELDLDFCKNSWLGIQEHADKSIKCHFKMVSRRVKYNKMFKCCSVGCV